MKRENTGKYVVISTIGEKVNAYIPAPLPPHPLPELSAAGNKLLMSSVRALGALDALGEHLPDVAPFIYACIRKEAVYSSMIEGTQSSLSDLLLYEQGGYERNNTDDVEEVSHYVSAMQLGMARMQEGYPISLRLIKELHAELLRRGRGATKMPGEFRQSQNWIGGTRPGNAVYVPPPPQDLMDCLGALELFINRDDALSPLVKAALVHVQFESIHPFLDGNGRVGRLLIQMMLCNSGLLKKPLLYLSLYFKQHRQEYYRLLNGIRQDGNWEAWIEFFLDAVQYTASDAVSVLTELQRSVDHDKAIIATFGRMRKNAEKVLSTMQRHIVTRPLILARKIGIAPSTIYRVLDKLEEHGIVLQNTQGERNRLYTYSAYQSMLGESSRLHLTQRN